jgi:NTP pyrophosphatase (non-canonical NTP hydrolase)
VSVAEWTQRSRRWAALFFSHPESGAPGPLTIREWQKVVYAQAKARGWHSEAHPDLADYLMNLHSELSELWEAYRARRLTEPCDKADNMRALGLHPLSCLEEELADVAIRVLDTAEAFGIDLDRAMHAKHVYNGTRPFRHGNKLA